jgi:hypothetical protein
MVRMIVGFTGTREGMTPKQKQQLRGFLELLPFTEFHHGDCVGADDEAVIAVHNIRTGPHGFFSPKIRIIKHPPVKGRYQANNPLADEVRPDLPYLERNANIAFECDILIAAPKEKSEVQRRGTWHTIRQAWKNGKTTIILSP